MTHADSSPRLLGRSRDTTPGAALPPDLASSRPPAAYLPGLDISVYGVAPDGTRYELPAAAAVPREGCPVPGCGCGGAR